MASCPRPGAAGVRRYPPERPQAVVRSRRLQARISTPEACEPCCTALTRPPPSGLAGKQTSAHARIDLFRHRHKPLRGDQGFRAVGAPQEKTSPSMLFMQRLFGARRSRIPSSPANASWPRRLTRWSRVLAAPDHRDEAHAGLALGFMKRYAYEWVQATETPGDCITTCSVGSIGTSPSQAGQDRQPRRQRKRAAAKWTTRNPQGRSLLRRDARRGEQRGAHLVEGRSPLWLVAALTLPKTLTAGALPPYSRNRTSQGTFVRKAVGGGWLVRLTRYISNRSGAPRDLAIVG